MLTENTLENIICCRDWVASLVKVLQECWPDFAAEQQRFQDAVRTLPKDAVPSAEEVLDAVDRMIGSNLLFTFCLGLKSNADHFTDPTAPSVLDSEPEIYLREDAAAQLPGYQSGQAVLDLFYDILSPDRLEDVLSYLCLLETVGPKLAHYYGYLIGNRLFPHILPGYREDSRLTLQYKQMLEAYLGFTFC